MGKTKGVNQAEFEVGSEVRIADRAFVEEFPPRPGNITMSSSPSRLEFAGRTAKVKAVEFSRRRRGFTPWKASRSVWHEECLAAA